MTKLLLGLSGFAGSGKDTVGEIIVAHHGYVRYAFGDALKQMLYAINPLTQTYRGVTRLAPFVDDVGWDRAKQEPDVRELLQRTGTEGGREVLGPMIWVNEVRRHLPEHSHVVITDVRFRSEAEMIVQEGGYVWRIERPGCDAPNDHASEHDLDDWDFDRYVANDGTLEDLSALVTNMVAPGVKVH
jgi:hypothetical protein